MMADVMGHGGEGDGEPSPRGFGGPSHHQQDTQPMNGRGRGKNLKLFEKWAANGKRPLPLVWDRTATYIPVGGYYDLFIREAGDYIWRDIPLDKKSWAEVPKAEKNGLWEWEHLRTYFDFDSIKNDPDGRSLWEGIECQVGKRYRGRKASARNYFGENGGLRDVERARTNPPGYESNKLGQCG